MRIFGSNSTVVIVIWIRMAMTKEKQDTMSHEESINTAFLHCNCSAVDSSPSESLQSFSTRPPLPAYIYSYIYTPGLYRIDMGVFLALWQWA